MAAPFPLVLALATLTGWALFLGVLFDRPELFIVTAPLIAAMLSARQPADPAGLALSTEVSANRLLEGDRLTFSMTLASAKPVPLLDIVLPLSSGYRLLSGCNRVVLSLHPGEPNQRTFELQAVTRGHATLGYLHLRTFDHSGLRNIEASLGAGIDVQVFPNIPRVRRLPRPLSMRSSFGNYVAPRLGDGLELGEIRPFVPGDQPRHVNWQTSLRLGRLYVTRFHEERNADVMLLLDTLAETGASPNSSLDACVRAAGALAAAYLARKDRVGLIEYGGYLRWIRPGSGRRHLESLIEAVLPVEVTFTYVAKDLNIVPPRVLPPQALIIAISSLVDDRFADAIGELAARGFDLLVLAVSPVELTLHALPASELNTLACRLWSLEWQSRVHELRQHGLPIVEWNPESPLETVLALLGRYRPTRRLPS